MNQNGWIKLTDGQYPPEMSWSWSERDLSVVSFLYIPPFDQVGCFLDLYSLWCRYIPRGSRWLGEHYPQKWWLSKRAVSKVCVLEGLTGEILCAWWSHFEQVTSFWFLKIKIEILILINLKFDDLVKITVLDILKLLGTHKS